MKNIMCKILRICNFKFKCNYLKNEKLFFEFFVQFEESRSNIKHFQTKDDVANVFAKLQTVKNLGKPLSKKRRFGTHIDSQHVKASQILAKYPRERFLYVFSSFSGKLIWKISPLVLGEILAESFNTLTADGKNFLQDCENLPVPIQMQLSKNQNLFLNILSHFLNLYQILNILKQTMIPTVIVFQKLQTVKNLLRLLSKKRRFRTRFDSQHVKVFQILAKSQWEQFYDVFSSFSGKLIWKTSPLVLGKILEGFVNILIADNKYPVQDCENLPLPIKMQLCEK